MTFRRHRRRRRVGAGAGADDDLASSRDRSFVACEDVVGCRAEALHSTRHWVRWFFECVHQAGEPMASVLAADSSPSISAGDPELEHVSDESACDFGAVRDRVSGRVVGFPPWRVGDMRLEARGRERFFLLVRLRSEI